MKLLTKAIEKRLPAIGSTYGLGKAATIVVKYFNPIGAATWWITEGEREGDDWRLFGYADLFGGSCAERSPDAELGYVMLSELEGIETRWGLGIERDIHYGFKHTLAEVMG